MSASASVVSPHIPGLLLATEDALLLLASLIVLVAIYVRVRPAPNVPESLPGPRPRLPLFGVALTADYDWPRWPTKCLELSRQYGFRTWGGPTLNVGFGPAFFVILSEVNVRHVLRDRSDNYVKGGPATGCLKEMFGTVLFGADGERWKVHRSAVTPKFSTGEATRKSFDIVSRKVDEVCEVLDCVNRTKGGADKAGVPTIDVQDLFMRMTQDIAMEIAFGVKMETVKKGDNHRQFIEAMEELTLHALS